jgi:hypothetical protein
MIQRLSLIAASASVHKETNVLRDGFHFIYLLPQYNFIGGERRHFHGPITTEVLLVVGSLAEVTETFKKLGL